MERGWDRKLAPILLIWSEDVSGLEVLKIASIRRERHCECKSWLSFHEAWNQLFDPFALDHEVNGVGWR